MIFPLTPARAEFPLSFFNLDSFLSISLLVHWEEKLAFVIHGAPFSSSSFMRFTVDYELSEPVVSLSYWLHVIESHFLLCECLTADEFISDRLSPSWPSP